MKDLMEQNALPSHKDDFFPNTPENPQQICSSLIARLLSLIGLMEQVLKTPLLAEHLDFLDAIATHFVALESLCSSAEICSESVQETSRLIDNLIRCMVSVPNQGFSLSSLDAAKIYRRNRKSNTPFSILLKSYSENKEHTESLLSTLKSLACDLILEKGNI
jgi:hypothetical protein